MAQVSLAVEGAPDEVVARRLCLLTGHQVCVCYGKGGKSLLDLRLPGYNAAAKHAPWFVLRDLDNDADCAPALKVSLLGRVSARMCFRIPVHSVESWLMADHEAMARYLAVKPARVPQDVEAIPNLKQTLVNLARVSRRKAIRDEMVPRRGAGSMVGRGYTAHLIEFAQVIWDPARAADRSPSLARCIAALASLR